VSRRAPVEQASTQPVESASGYGARSLGSYDTQAYYGQPQPYYGQGQQAYSAQQERKSANSGHGLDLPLVRPGREWLLYAGGSYTLTIAATYRCCNMS
jgi:hypothetical protein